MIVQGPFPADSFVEASPVIDAPARRAFLNALSERELRFVAMVWRGTRQAWVRRAAISISWLGNGLVYPVLAAVLLVTGSRTPRPILLAAASIALAHCAYPRLKTACARRRPWERREEITPLMPALDRHSFPSGHVMTLTAAAVPLVQPNLASWTAAIGCWLAMAWARIACGHHYPSDTLAGGLLGLAIAVPVCRFAGWYLPA